MISAAILLLLLRPASAGEYQQALPGYSFSFPKDHFAHPEFRTEWWYYTGNLWDSNGGRFGFELVFFRQGQRRGKAENPSAWRVDDLHLAHLALTDVRGGGFYYQKRLNRAGPGLAGASFNRRRVWNGNWSVQWRDAKQRLQAVADDFRFTFEAIPQKPPVIHGVGGVSQKADGPGRASHYVSFTRLRVSGSLSIHGRTRQVQGTAWMDHEWFSHQLEAEQVGWDWFSVQLDDQTELMLFQLRRSDGSIDPHSAGTFVDAAGRSRHLAQGDFRLQPLSWWTSPKTGSRYPVHWRVRVLSLGLDIECTAALRQQEIPAEGGGPSYWEGAVSYRGTHTGVGYLEMTGYDGPVRLD